MSRGYGPTTVQTLGAPIRASAGEMIPKPGGVTLDWAKVTAVSGSDKTLTDGQIVKVGEKFIRYGTVLCRIQTAEVQTLTIDAAGGTFTLSYGGGTTAAIAYNAAASAVQAALEAMVDGNGVHILPAGAITVTGNAGGPYTITFNYDLGNVAAITTNAASLTGGAGTAVIATATGGANTGLFAPYDSTQTDGRQVLRSGDCFVLDTTVIDSEEHSLYPNGAFDAGLVYKKRVLNNGNDLLTNPTEANFHTAFPGIRFVTD